MVIVPEFPMPERALGDQVIAGIYVPRPADPMWVIVTQRSEERFSVLLWKQTEGIRGYSSQSYYDIPTHERALKRMREKASFWDGGLGFPNSQIGTEA